MKFEVTTDPMTGETFNWLTATMVERIAHVALNASRIYVRARIDGRWRSVALSDLPREEQVAETKRLIHRDVEPSKVVS